MITQDSRFLVPKISAEIPMGSLLTEVPNGGGVGYT